ncbi:hypothetical protein L1987_02042 [Smallanthus sonchifolius]|uniref:Uncharacterized protein n=1 Tax=Smallanthus sonchifolius TaxID=185202 RepID=A0ACB9K6T0_9ASTR|nr:hypothetical protein L1987_02042 [Smallanthus sonchifolius]
MIAALLGIDQPSSMTLRPTVGIRRKGSGTKVEVGSDWVAAVGTVVKPLPESNIRQKAKYSSSVGCRGSDR